jgi:DNA polymerase V
MNLNGAHTEALPTQREENAPDKDSFPGPAPLGKTGFAIVDCNSFYCSCERVFRPDLGTKPVVVLSNNDGCIISRSDEAKKLGVGMAGAYFLEKNTIERHGISVFSSNYPLYGDMSWRVMETLRMLSGDHTNEKVEVYSVDEAFVDLKDIPFEQWESFARNIKEKVEQWTGISVSVGLAPTKTLAKMANQLAKKNKKETGCVKSLIREDEIRSALRGIRVDSIWGVGRAYAQKLINSGITSAWELSRMNEEWASAHLGGVVGVRLIRELRGEPSIVFEKELLNKRMIATTRMFGRPVYTMVELKEAVATYISRAAEKLRRQRCAARVVSVFLVPREAKGEFNPYRQDAQTGFTTLAAASSLTQDLIKPALDLVEQLFENGREYKKAGVTLQGLVPDSSIQGNLFVGAASDQRRFLMDAVDNVNFSMRDDAVKFVASGLTRNWKMRQELRSGRYSTRWEELRVVH